MPVDVIPDFIPVAGQLDDAILVAVVLRFVLRGGGPEMLDEHWPGAPEKWAADRQARLWRFLKRRGRDSNPRESLRPLLA